MQSHKLKKIVISLVLILALSFSLKLQVQAADNMRGLKDKFTIYSYTRNNYTGVASTKSVLLYLSGFEYDQSELAGLLKASEDGTYLSNIVDFINQQYRKQEIDIYDGDDFDTVIYSLYDTVVRKDTPSIIGVMSDQSEGWPYDMAFPRYVVVTGVSEDLKYVRIADPTGPISKNDEIESFYNVPVEVVFKAYEGANTGLTYVKDIDIMEKYGVEDSTVAFILDSNLYQNDGNKQIDTLVINNSDVVMTYSVAINVQQYDEATRAWKLIRPHTPQMITKNLVITGPRDLSQHTYYMDDYNFSPGIYRLYKQFDIGGQAHVLYTDSFTIE